MQNNILKENADLDKRDEVNADKRQPQQAKQASQNQSASARLMRQKDATSDKRLSLVSVLCRGPEEGERTDTAQVVQFCAADLHGFKVLWSLEVVPQSHA